MPHNAERSGSVDRALDCGSKGCQFETHLSHCVVLLSITFYMLLSTVVGLKILVSEKLALYILVMGR